MTFKHNVNSLEEIPTVNVLVKRFGFNVDNTFMKMFYSSYFQSFLAFSFIRHGSLLSTNK